MAVDKGYGSGKSRSAANSAARRRAAEGKMTKGKKGIASKIKAANTARANSPLGKIADTVLGFALPVGKVKAAAMGLRVAGKVGQAAALEGRVAAKTAGNKISSNINFWERNFNNGRFPVNSDIPGKIRGAQTKRSVSESVFPRSSSGTLESVPGLNPSSARSAAKSFGRAASSERGAARSLRNVPGERDRSMKLFKDSLANERAGRAIAKYKNTKGGR